MKSPFTRRPTCAAPAAVVARQRSVRWACSRWPDAAAEAPTRRLARRPGDERRHCHLPPRATTQRPRPPHADTTATSQRCQVVPEETAGPYPADGSNASNNNYNVLALAGIVRSDIRTNIGGSAQVGGAPLTLTITLTNTQSSARRWPAMRSICGTARAKAPTRSTPRKAWPTTTCAACRRPTRTAASLPHRGARLLRRAHAAHAPGDLPEPVERHVGRQQAQDHAARLPDRRPCAPSTTARPAIRRASPTSNAISFATRQRVQRRHLARDGGLQRRRHQRLQRQHRDLDRGLTGCVHRHAAKCGSPFAATMPRLTLFRKIFLALAVLLLALLLIFAGFSRLGLQRGLGPYVAEIEIRRMDWFAELLKKHHAAEGNWDALRNDEARVVPPADGAVPGRGTAGQQCRPRPERDGTPVPPWPPGLPAAAVQDARPFATRRPAAFAAATAAAAPAAAVPPPGALLDPRNPPDSVYQRLGLVDADDALDRRRPGRPRQSPPGCRCATATTLIGVLLLAPLAGPRERGRPRLRRAAIELRHLDRHGGPGDRAAAVVAAGAALVRAHRRADAGRANASRRVAWTRACRCTARTNSPCWAAPSTTWPSASTASKPRAARGWPTSPTSCARRWPRCVPRSRRCRTACAASTTRPRCACTAR